MCRRLRCRHDGRSASLPSSWPQRLRHSRGNRSRQVSPRSSSTPWCVTRTNTRTPRQGEARWCTVLARRGYLAARRAETDRVRAHDVAPLMDVQQEKVPNEFPIHGTYIRGTKSRRTRPVADRRHRPSRIDHAVASGECAGRLSLFARVKDAKEHRFDRPASDSHSTAPPTWPARSSSGRPPPTSRALHRRSRRLPRRSRAGERAPAHRGHAAGHPCGIPAGMTQTIALVLALAASGRTDAPDPGSPCSTARA